MKVTLIDKNTNGIETMLTALNLCRDKQCTEQTIDQCLMAKPIPHLSVLEFCWFCFLVEGVSVKARIQQLRHRHFSTMERSTRSIDVGGHKTIVPPMITNREGFKAHYKDSVAAYDVALILDGLEDAAYLLPLGIETKFVLAGNGRVWFEYLQKRLCLEFVQTEHYLLAKELHKQLVKEIPQFKYANPCLNCKQCHEQQ